MCKHCPTVGDLVHWLFNCVRCNNQCQTTCTCHTTNTNSNQPLNCCGCHQQTTITAGNQTNQCPRNTCPIH